MIHLSHLAYCRRQEGIERATSSGKNLNYAGGRWKERRMWPPEIIPEKAVTESSWRLLATMASYEVEEIVPWLGSKPCCFSLCITEKIFIDCLTLKVLIWVEHGPASSQRCWGELTATKVPKPRYGPSFCFSKIILAGRKRCRKT